MKMKKSLFPPTEGNTVGWGTHGPSGLAAGPVTQDKFYIPPAP